MYIQRTSTIPELRLEPEEKSRKTMSGYYHETTGVFVPDDDALEYALDQIGLSIYSQKLFDKFLSKGMSKADFAEVILMEGLGFTYEHEYPVDYEWCE